mgnify:CR=1 FL=1
MKIGGNIVKKKLSKWFYKTLTYIKSNATDILVLLAGLIIGINSCFINLHFGFYVIALEFIVLAYSLSKFKGEEV